MSVSNFIKQNFVLVLGIALPLLLVLGFMITAAVPPKTGPKPLYPVLFTVYNYNNSSPYNVEYVVKDKKLYARLTLRKDQYGTSRRDIYLFDAQTDTITKLDPTLPDSLDGHNQLDVQVTEMAGKRVDNASKSPDGYTLENDTYRSRGLVGDLFGGRSGYYASRLRHDSGWSYKIPDYAGKISYANIEFVGWVTSPATAE